jgi:hypothetical protein
MAGLPHKAASFCQRESPKASFAAVKNPPPTRRASAFPFGQSAGMKAIPTIARVTSEALNLSFVGIFPLAIF